MILFGLGFVIGSIFGAALYKRHKERVVVMCSKGFDRDAFLEKFEKVVRRA